MRTTRAFIVWTLGLLAAGGLQAAREDPVQWTLQPVKGFERVKPGAAAWLELTATIQPGWHLYSPTTPPGGPIPTKIELTPNAAVTGAKVWRQQPVRRLDPNFNIDTETYADSAIFYIQADTKPGSSGPITFEASAYYQACSDVKCLRPVTRAPSAAVTLAASAKCLRGTLRSLAGMRSSWQQPRGGCGSRGSSPAPRPSAEKFHGGGALSVQQDLLPFLLTAFVFGLAAIFTPCVFPMIPITVSFFLNQDTGTERASRAAPLSQALVFCLGIIVLFTGLGFLVTAIAGPFGVVSWVQVPGSTGLSLPVFLVFGLSLLGAFELLCLQAC